MKETAFDCALNYKDNSRNPVNSSGIICMDYPSKNREDYLFTPDMDDTIEHIDTKQEKIEVIQYTKIVANGKTYYYNTVPNAEGKIYIYDENPAKKIRLPKAVGEIRVVNGVKQVVLFKKNKRNIWYVALGFKYCQRIHQILQIKINFFFREFSLA